MPKLIKKNNQSAIELEIARILEEMKTTTSDSDEYAKLVKNLDSLTKIANNNEDKISKETVLTIAANLGGIAMILTHENTHALTSKALGFIMKAKL